MQLLGHEVDIETEDGQFLGVFYCCLSLESVPTTRVGSHRRTIVPVVEYLREIFEVLPCFKPFMMYHAAHCYVGGGDFLS